MTVGMGDITVVRFSPIATEGDWPWTRGRITKELLFAVEYKRAKTLCAEYNEEGWHVNVKGTPAGDSLGGMRLVGEIDTSGEFTKANQ